MRKKEEITVKDGAKDKLVRLFKVISWLDDKRWNQERDTFVGKFNSEILNDDDLKPDEKILAHWLIYITNRGKDAVTLWENNTPVIKDLVRKYKRCSSPKDISRLCKKRLYKYNSKKKEEELAIQAYPVDVKSIWRTLVVLLDYDKNIIQFMTEKVLDWNKNEFNTRLAFRLHLLSYKDVGSSRQYNTAKVLKLLVGTLREKEMENIKRVLSEEREFEKEYEVWDRWKGTKRTWAALRDYKKHKTLSEIFINDIENNKQELWEENFRKENLELPGDTWNNKPSFRENIFAELIELKDIRDYKNPKNLWMSRVVRQLYDRLKELDEDVSGFYPEQFDVTFDFVPRMCEKRLCDFCPFSEKGMKSISKICNPSKDKYCPVALFTCGYFAECKEDGCEIKKGLGKGICQRRTEVGVGE